MKTKLIAAALLVTTAAAVGFYPAVDGRTTGPGPIAAGDSKKIEVVFVLDTTSSMTNLIATAKEKIWSIATTLASASQVSDIEIGLVAYRDRGDDYVTRVVDLRTDLDTMYAELMQFAAVGGGDMPESVNRALGDAVNSISWSQSPSTYRAIFLVGDAPPKHYQDESGYADTIAAAVANGIVVNTIQCGDVPDTVGPWTEIARLGNGRYLKVDQDGGAFDVTTPYDDELAQLSSELDRTRLFYGDEDEMLALDAKVAATEEIEQVVVTGTRARRAVFNATEAGRRNLYGDQDLVDGVMRGEVTLDEVPVDELPASFRELDRADQAAQIREIAQRRARIEAEIRSLSESRAAFIDERVEEAGGADDSLDRQLYEIVREQAAPAGLTFDGGAAF